MSKKKQCPVREMLEIVMTLDDTINALFISVAAYLMLDYKSRRRMFGTGC